MARVAEAAKYGVLATCKRRGVVLRSDWWPPVANSSTDARQPGRAQIVARNDRSFLFYLS